MCAMKCVVFDLDGTLTESAEGIQKSAVYAMEKMGLPRPTDDQLRQMIGPPLRWFFGELLGLNEEDTTTAVKCYRERYFTVGLFENSVYPGIRRVLRTLKREGWYVAVATGKPEEPARRILRHFGLDRWLDSIVGTGDRHGAEKEDLILAALPESRDEAWMVGDRLFDIEGGRKAGTKTIGVTYGYGTEEELRQAGCDECVDSPQGILDVLCPGAAPVPGMFLSMEGLDGCGKSTQLAALREGLTRWGYEVVCSREPGGSPLAEIIRGVILDPKNTAMTAETEALLYAASRAQHVREVIRPAVAEGKLLLSDRYVDSSVAYQGGGRELGVQRVLDINAPAVDGTMPLATVYLDIDHVTSLNRRHAATEPDRIEREGGAFFARIEAAYRELIRRDPERFIVIDASRDIETISAEMLERVLARLAEAENE